MWSELFFLIVVCVSVYFYFLFQNEKRRLPGPWGLPLLGHLPLMGASPHKKLTEWSHDYGPIFQIRFGSFPTVVLKDPKLIREAFGMPELSGRGQIEPFATATEGKGFAFIDGPDCLEQRRFVIKNMHDFGRSTAEEKIKHEIVELLSHLRNEVNNGGIINVNRLFSNFVINGLWSIIIGERFKNGDPDIRRLVHLVSEKLLRTDTFIGKLAMFIPWLGKLVPNLSKHAENISACQEVYDYLGNQLNKRKESWVKGQPRDLTDAYFDKVAKTTNYESSFHPSRHFQEQSMMDIFIGGLDSTSTTLEWMINYMARCPQVQQKLQQEIDHVVGSNRLPDLADRLRMPYAEAVVQELLRLPSVAPLAFYHRALTEVTLQGYTISKDTMIVANTYGVHHSVDIWGDPQVFRPERFLDENGNFCKSDNIFAFSCGRRSCIGADLGRDQLFLYTTSIVQKFRVVAPSNSEAPNEFFGITLQPSPFQVKLIERN